MTPFPLDEEALQTVIRAEADRLKAFITAEALRIAQAELQTAQVFTFPASKPARKGGGWAGMSKAERSEAMKARWVTRRAKAQEAQRGRV